MLFTICSPEPHLTIIEPFPDPDPEESLLEKVCQMSHPRVDGKKFSCPEVLKNWILESAFLGQNFVGGPHCHTFFKTSLA